jgi:hypothetical protein
MVLLFPPRINKRIIECRSIINVQENIVGIEIVLLSSEELIKFILLDDLGRFFNRLSIIFIIQVTFLRENS